MGIKHVSGNGLAHAVHENGLLTLRFFCLFPCILKILENILCQNSAVTAKLLEIDPKIGGYPGCQR